MAAIYCYAHAREDAATTCDSCLRPICNVCSVLESHRWFCPQCVGAHRARLRRRNSFVAAFAVIALLAGGYYLVEEKRGALPSAGPAPVTFNYGEYAREISAFR